MQNFDSQIRIKGAESHMPGMQNCDSQMHVTGAELHMPGMQNFEAMYRQLFVRFLLTVSPWFSLDIAQGCITLRLEKEKAFSAEVRPVPYLHYALLPVPVCPVCPALRVLFALCCQPFRPCAPPHASRVLRPAHRAPCDL